MIFYRAILEHLLNLIGRNPNPPKRRRINPEGLELIKSCEGLSLVAYPDIGGIWTIGYGFTGGVKEGMHISEHYAEALLLQALAPVEGCISEHVRCELTSNEFSALCSFVYNIGIGHFLQSTMLLQLNAGNKEWAALEFRVWCFAMGTFVQGLENRRIKEKELFLKKEG